MGLDNGICVKSENIDLLKKFGLPIRKARSGTEVEICYWRKCWGIRSFILDEIGGENQDKFKYDIPKEKIDDIMITISFFDNEENWNDYADSIWDFCQMEGNLSDQIIQLCKLQKILETNPDDTVEIYFYDSY